MLKRILIFIHRWLGVAVCPLFLLWFSSGIGMMYVEFPSISPADRLEHSPAIDRSTIALSPADAYATLGLAEPPVSARLNTFDGRPVYRFIAGFSEHLVYADTGATQGAISTELLHRIAAAWTKQPTGAATVQLIDEVDQWTIPMGVLDPVALWKYSWPSGDEVYVSQSSGDVVQHTTTASRIAAYLGPIPHWLYFTPLRKHGREWSQLVVWSSGIGAIAALLGVGIGVWVYSPSRRYLRSGVRASIPYRGPKRWHMALGLVCGITAATWAFSGMLSMDPFSGPGGDTDRGDAGLSVVRALAADDLELEKFSTKHPREALAQVGGLEVKELELASFAGEPMYMATLGRETRVVPVRGEPRVEIGRDLIVDIVTQAALPAGVADIRVIDQYDAYYLDRRHRLPLPVIRARLNDADETRIYIDPRTAGVVGGYSSQEWTTRWAYRGLHSFDFPWLYANRPAWDVVVLTLMLGGMALCMTSLVLAWGVLGRILKGLGNPRTSSAQVLSPNLARSDPTIEV